DIAYARKFDDVIAISQHGFDLHGFTAPGNMKWFKGKLPDGREVMLIDTVGLVRRLPHTLVDAFRSTLEEAAFAAKGLNWRYITLRVTKENLKTAFDGMKAMGFRGFNLTMPHKRAIIPYLDELSEAAQIIGAVNTVVCRDGRWLGDNTDGKGFISALELDGISPKAKNITILGAGGAARAIAVECALAGADAIRIINRSRDNGEQLVQLLNEKTAAKAEYLPWDGTVTIPEDTQILINATCVGLHPNIDEKPDIDYTTVSAQMVVCDVVFNPVEPKFLQEAKKRGAKTVSGIGMLVQQGALGFTLWTGETAPTNEMYRTLASEFGA
ncbi:MAG: shikimate dehydrogenase, partial [Oscillospiraceae bacterium]|nr:shikimate dehydrogenase [Oscillospiraceae bacterium]